MPHDGLDLFRSRRVGLALSGGSVRGLAHIGVIKALSEAGVSPIAVAGTSAGSLVGAGLAAGLGWRELHEMARAVFWPSLLYGDRLEQFCAAHLPPTFADLALPFAVVATALPSRDPVTITRGPLASAISASCAQRVLRRPVIRDGQRLEDGGTACVMPALPCRRLGVDLVIGSDVWELSSLLRRLGCDPAGLHGRRLYPTHYLAAVDQTDLLVQPPIPLSGYVPGAAAVERMIEAGAAATRRALARWARRPGRYGSTRSANCSDAESVPGTRSSMR